MVGEQGTSQIFHVTVRKIIMDELKATHQADGKHSMFIALMILCIKPFVWGKGKMSKLPRTKRAHQSIKPMEATISGRERSIASTTISSM